MSRLEKGSKVCSKYYAPVVYVDTDGVLYDKEELKNKEYKKLEKYETEIENEWGQRIVYTTRNISVPRKKPTQGELF